MPLPPQGTICYTGTSMSPTLMDGDCLTYRRQSSYRRGDVVIFSEPSGKDFYMIHRIVRTVGGRHQTAGDGNRVADMFFLCPEQVVGRVMKKTRSGRTYAVAGGCRGTLRYWYCRRGKRRLRPLFLFLEPAFSRLALRINPWFASRLAVQPIIVLSEDSGVRIWLRLHRWCAGWWDSSGNQWYIRPEFRLFVDARRLPDGPKLLQAEGIALPSRGQRGGAE